MDMNDRSLRQIIIGLVVLITALPREEGFNITPVSEVMAILCLSKDFEDLKNRLGNIFVGYTFDKNQFCQRFECRRCYGNFLKDAILEFNSNLEGNPAIFKLETVCQYCTRN